MGYVRFRVHKLAYAKYDSHCRKLHMRIGIEKGCDPRFHRRPPGPGTVLFSQATAPGENWASREGREQILSQTAGEEPYPARSAPCLPGIDSNVAFSHSPALDNSDPVYFP